MNDKIKTILFPSSYFSDKIVDEDMKKEYDSVIDTSLYDVILFSYDKWFNNNKLKLNQIPKTTTYAVYRGWMMKPEQYESFYNLLKENNIILVTNPKQYKTMHIFPNIYSEIKEDTAGTIIYNSGESVNLDEIKSKFPKFMVKDFVKSVKGTNFPKYFDSTVTKEEFENQMKLFYKYRGNLLTGGICIKATPHNHRLPPLPHICLQIFRHIA